jgi:signal recognition particle receptor subunit beta
MERQYKKGGCSCRGTRFFTKGKDGKETTISVMNGEKGKKVAKNVMYCENDFQINQGFKAKGGRGRILPEKFLEHRHYKVLIIGSKRAGKSTFISRLFDIAGKETNLDMTAEMLRNATKKTEKINSYPMKNLPAREDGAPMFSAKSWYKVAEMPRRHYGGYSIRLADGAYPEPTNTADLSAYPFVLKVGERDYVYFYDIAGEDAEKDPDLMKKMLAGGATGVLFLVDGKTNREGNNSVWNSLNQIASNTKLPLAVVLTKFDTIEKEFDENCHCLRADAYDMLSKRYDGSQLEQNIELASEEIHSYLIHRGIDPKLSFENVCYFGVSSFSDSGAVFHRDQTSNEDKEINYLKHDCSAKRMELPVIWMLKQFGCII